MKEKDQRSSLSYVDEKKDSSNSSTTTTRKDVYDDDSCFKAPLLLPHRYFLKIIKLF